MTRRFVAAVITLGLVLVAAPAWSQMRYATATPGASAVRPVGLFNHIFTKAQSDGCCHQAGCAEPASCGCDKRGCENSCCSSCSEGLLPKLWCRLQGSMSRVRSFRSQCRGCNACNLPMRVPCCTEPVCCQKPWLWAAYSCPRSKCRPSIFSALTLRLACRADGCSTCAPCSGSCPSCPSACNSCTACNTGSACRGCAEAAGGSLPKSPFLNTPPAPEKLEEPLRPPTPPAETLHRPGTRSQWMVPTKATAANRQRRLIPASTGPSLRAPTNVAPALRSVRRSLMKVSQASHAESTASEEITLRAQTPQTESSESLNNFAVTPAERHSQPQKSDSAGASAEIEALPMLIKFRAPANPPRDN